MGPDIVVAGPFGSVNNTLRTGLVLLSPEAPATVRDFNARLDGGVDALASSSAATGAKLVAGGSFGSSGAGAGQPRDLPPPGRRGDLGSRRLPDRALEGEGAVSARHVGRLPREGPLAGVHARPVAT